MDFTSWKNIVIEWVNCLELMEQPIHDIMELEDGVFFNKFLEKVERQAVRRSTSLCNNKLQGMQRVLRFMNNEYPFLHLIETTIKEEKCLLLIAATLIYHGCIKCTGSSLTSVMCRKLPADIQRHIADFLKMVQEYGMSKDILDISMNVVRSKSRNNEESIFTNSPNMKGTQLLHSGRSSLREFFESPAAQQHNMTSSWKQDINRLQLQLDDEVYEKGILQEKLNEAVKKIKELELKYFNKVQENLNATVHSDSCDSPTNKDILIREKEILKKDKLYYESYCDKLENDILKLKSEQEALNFRLKSAEDDKKLWQKKFEDLSVLFEGYEKSLEQKESEVSYLREQCIELADCIQALKEEHTTKEQADLSSMSGYGEDLGQGVIDLLMQEKQEENEKLKVDLHTLQAEKLIVEEQLTTLINDNEDLQMMKEKLLSEVTELTNFKLEILEEDSRKTKLIDELEKEVKLLTSNIFAKENECTALYEEMKDMEKTLGSVGEKLHETELMLSSKFEEVSQLSRENDQLNTKLNELAEKNKLYENDLWTLNNDYLVEQNSFSENLKMLMGICEIPDFHFVGYDNELEVAKLHDGNKFFKSLSNFLICKSLMLSAKYSVLKDFQEENMKRLELLKQENTLLVQEKECLIKNFSLLQNENCSFVDVVKDNAEKICNLQKLVEDSELLIKKLNYEKDVLTNGFETKVSDLNTQIQTYGSKLSDVCNQKFVVEERYSKIKHDLEEIIKNLIEEVTVLLENNKTLESEKSSAEIRVQDLNKFLAEALIEKNEVAGKLSTALEETNKIPDLLSEIKVLKKQLQEFREVKVELAYVREEMLNVKNDYKNLSVQKESFENNLHDYRNEISLKSNEVLILNKNIVIHLNEIADLKSNIVDNEKQLELTSNKLNDVNVEFKQTKINLDTLKSENNANKSLIFDYETNLDQLFALCPSMSGDNIFIGGQYEKFVKIKEYIESLKANTNKAVKDLELQQECCNDLTKQNNSLELREQVLHKEKETLEMKTKELRESIYELKEMLKTQTNKCNDFQHIIEEKSAEILEIKRNREFEINNVNDERALLQKCLVEYEAREKNSKESFDKTLGELKDRIKSATCELISLTERKKLMEVDLCNKQKECEELKVRLLEVTVKNSELSSKLISVGEEKNQLNEKLGVETIRCTNLTNEKAGILAMKNLLQDKVKELESELYKGKFKAGREAADQFEQLSSDYRKVWEELTDTKAKLAVSLKECKDTKAKLEVALKECQDERDNARKTEKELELRCSEIEENVKTVYEGKLQRLKDRMKMYYSTEMEQIKSSVESQTAKVYKDKIKSYEKELKEFEVQMWDMRMSLLKALEEKKAAEEKMRKLTEEKGKSLEANSADDYFIDINETFTFTRSKSVFRRFPPSVMDKFLQEEDEQGETFSETHLADLKEGRCNPETFFDPSKRISELQFRNSLCPPHLKSSYPAETNFYDSKNAKEEDIKLGICSNEAFDYDNFDTLSTSQLIPVEKRRKDRGQTSYRKPGPPTPCKNGNSSVQIQSGTPRPVLRDCNDGNTQKKRQTPSRIKSFFANKSMRRDENTPVTPRSKRLNIFKRSSKVPASSKCNP